MGGTGGAGNDRDRLPSRSKGEEVSQYRVSHHCAINRPGYFLTLSDRLPALSDSLPYKSVTYVPDKLYEDAPVNFHTVV